MTNKTSDFLQLFRDTGDGAWAVDAEQRIILWNEAAEESLGYAAEEALGQFCYELLSRRDLGGRPVCRARCAISECARRGEPISTFNLRMQCRDPQSAWIDVSGILVPERSAEDG